MKSQVSRFVVAASDGVSTTCGSGWVAFPARPFFTLKGGKAERLGVVRSRTPCGSGRGVPTNRAQRPEKLPSSDEEGWERSEPGGSCQDPLR
jgi:hypothetical protein